MSDIDFKTLMTAYESVFNHLNRGYVLDFGGTTGVRPETKTSAEFEQNVTDVKRDGNCVFRCFSVVLHGSEEKWLDVKADLRKFLQAHDVILQSHHLGKSKDEFYKNYDEDGYWGGALEILGFANMTSTCVNVYHVDHVDHVDQQAQADKIHKQQTKLIFKYDKTYWEPHVPFDSDSQINLYRTREHYMVKVISKSD